MQTQRPTKSKQINKNNPRQRDANKSAKQTRINKPKANQQNQITQTTPIRNNANLKKQRPYTKPTHNSKTKTQPKN